MNDETNVTGVEDPTKVETEEGKVIIGKEEHNKKAIEKIKAYGWVRGIDVLYGMIFKYNFRRKILQNIEF